MGYITKHAHAICIQRFSSYVIINIFSRILLIIFLFLLKTLIVGTR